MQISANYIIVKRVEEPKQEGFQTVEIQDSFVYKGQVTDIPECPVLVSNKQIMKGDIVLFAKYSPDTIDLELEGEKVKFIKITDILALYE
jgi:co-chaperonin GroES (HSP10)